MQVVRTYPAKRPRYPFAPEGERSIARAYLKAIGRARSLVYLEDQYLWSVDAARALGDALRRHPALRVVAVDVTKPGGIAAALEASGPIDVLVNNAGIGLMSAFEAGSTCTAWMRGRRLVIWRGRYLLG